MNKRHVSDTRLALTPFLAGLKNCKILYTEMPFPVAVLEERIDDQIVLVIILH